VQDFVRRSLIRPASHQILDHPVLPLLPLPLLPPRSGKVGVGLGAGYRAQAYHFQQCRRIKRVRDKENGGRVCVVLRGYCPYLDEGYGCGSVHGAMDSSSSGRYLDSYNSTLFCCPSFVEREVTERGWSSLLGRLDYFCIDGC